MNRTILLVGTLGRTLDLRDTNPIRLDVDEHNDTPGLELIPPATDGRPFAIFSFLPHGAQRGAADPRIRCIVFDVESARHRPLREARPGELVAVAGHWGTYTDYLEETGETFTFNQLIVEDLYVLGPGLAGDAPLGERIVFDRRASAAA